MRYKNVNIINKKYVSVMMPKIQQNQNDIIILTKRQDRLDLLAKKYYGDVSLW